MELTSTRPEGWGDDLPVPAPLRLYEVTVPESWVDYNAHMSEWCYLLVMGNSSDALFRYIGIDEDYRNAGHSLFTVETHIHNLREVSLGDRLELAVQVLHADAKRIHLTHEITGRDDELVATGEQMLLHVDTTPGRVTAMPDELQDRVATIVRSHDALPVPEWVGHVMGLRGESNGHTEPRSTEEPAWTSS